MLVVLLIKQRKVTLGALVSVLISKIFILSPIGTGNNESNQKSCFTWDVIYFCLGYEKNSSKSYLTRKFCS